MEVEFGKKVGVDSGKKVDVAIERKRESGSGRRSKESGSGDPKKVEVESRRQMGGGGPNEL